MASIILCKRKQSDQCWLLLLLTLILITGPGIAAYAEETAPRRSENAIELSQERVGLSNNEILLGSCAPLSGTLRERGHEIVRGANLYFSYLNEMGGLFGRKIKLSTCDDAYDGQKSIDCFDSCLKNKVFAGCFFAGSVPIRNYLRLADANKMPMFGYVSGNPAIRDFHPEQFELRASYNDEVNRQIDELWSKRGIRKIGVLYLDDAAGIAVRAAVVTALAKYHGAPVVEASFPRKSTDVDASLQRCASAKPEAVILIGTSDGLVAILKRRYQQNLHALLVSVSISDDYVEGLKEADGLILTQVVPPMDSKLPAAELYRKLLHKQAAEAHPTMTSWETFLNAIALTEGLRRAGPDLTRTKFVQALETLRGFDLGAGDDYRVTFGPDNHKGWTSKNSVYFTVVKDGRISPITESDWSALVKKAKQQAR